MKWDHFLLVIFSLVIVLIQDGEGQGAFRGQAKDPNGVKKLGEECDFFPNADGEYLWGACKYPLVCAWSKEQEGRCMDTTFKAGG